MFKKLSDRLTNAVCNPGKIRQLRSMGFDETDAKLALEATNGDIEMAAGVLLEQQGQQGQGQSPRQQQQQRTVVDSITSTVSEERDPDIGLRNALEESRRTEEARMVSDALEASGNMGQSEMSTVVRERQYGTSAASRRAGEAALARFNISDGAFGCNGITREKGKGKAKVKARTGNKKQNGGKSDDGPVLVVPSSRGNRDLILRQDSVGLSHHPEVTIPQKMTDKTKEERVLRCAVRLRSHPPAIDTLHRALSALRSNPDNSKYRRLDTQSEGYIRTLEGVPGAEDFILTMNFRRIADRDRPRGRYLVLDRVEVDDALLYLGVSAMEEAKKSNDYQIEKRKIQFLRDMESARAIVGDEGEKEEEEVRRTACLSRLPAEPSAGTLIRVTLAPGPAGTISRMFDSDDILGDVLNWIGAHGSTMPNRIKNNEWILVHGGVTSETIDVSTRGCMKTLQSIGCWPSGRLEVRPCP